MIIQALDPLSLCLTVSIEEARKRAASNLLFLVKSRSSGRDPYFLKSKTILNHFLSVIVQLEH